MYHALRYCFILIFLYHHHTSYRRHLLPPLSPRPPSTLPSSRIVTWTHPSSTPCSRPLPPLKPSLLGPSARGGTDRLLFPSGHHSIPGLIPSGLIFFFSTINIYENSLFLFISRLWAYRRHLIMGRFARGTVLLEMALERLQWDLLMSFFSLSSFFPFSFFLASPVQLCLCVYGGLIGEDAHFALF